MIFFKNLFLLLLLLSIVLFAQDITIASQEIISTDSPEELIDNELHTYESSNPKNFEESKEQIETTLNSINTTIPIKEFYPQIVEVPTVPSEPIERPIPIYRDKKTIEETFNKLITQAKKEHKIILLEIYGTNCHFCKKMEKETFSKETVKEELKDNFIMLKVNGDEEYIPLDISMQMTPMHVFIAETKDIKDMTFGFLGEKDFLELLEKEKN